MEIAKSLGYGDPQSIRSAFELCEEVGKMIFAIATKLAASQSRPNKSVV
jgi:hypothetical protein